MSRSSGAVKMRLALLDEEDCCVCVLQQQLAGQAVTSARSSGEVKMRLELLMRGVVCMCYNGFMLQMKATSYLHAVLDQEGLAQTSWCSKWAAPCAMQAAGLAGYAAGA
jgi:hypothetical protein